MRQTDFDADPPAPEPGVSIDAVLTVAVAVTAALVAPFIVATYPVLFVAAIPMVAAAVAR